MQPDAIIKFRFSGIGWVYYLIRHRAARSLLPDATVKRALLFTPVSRLKKPSADYQISPRIFFVFHVASELKWYYISEKVMITFSDEIRESNMLDENERCQANIRGSHQCDRAREGVSEYCTKHGGNKANEADEKKRLYEFKSQVFQHRMSDKIGADKSKDLTSEIALLRMLIEERMNMIDPNNPNEFLLHSGPLADLIIKVEKVVTSCHKLEKAMGQHVDKSSILKFAGDMVQIISEEITDEKITRKIADRMMDVIKEVGQDD